MYAHLCSSTLQRTDIYHVLKCSDIQTYTVCSSVQIFRRSDTQMFTPHCLGGGLGVARLGLAGSDFSHISPIVHHISHIFGADLLTSPCFFRTFEVSNPKYPTSRRPFMPMDSVSSVNTTQTTLAPVAGEPNQAPNPTPSEESTPSGVVETHTSTNVDDLDSALDGAFRKRGVVTSQPNEPNQQSNRQPNQPNRQQPDQQPDKRQLTAEELAAIKARREFNHQQAALRIARKKARQEREQRYLAELTSLQQRNEQYKAQSGQGNPDEVASKVNDAMMQLTERQIEDLNQRYATEERQLAMEEWTREAREQFTPEDAETFLADSKTYGDWINKNEPELRAYIDKPYGKYLLKGWFDKVAKDPKMADKWESLNQFQKFQMLEKQYNALVQFGEQYAAGQVGLGGEQQPRQQPNQQQQQQPANVPVPGSGRSSNVEPSPDDIGGLIDRAMEKRRRLLAR